MGLLSNRWEAEWEGVAFTVHRNELTKGFSLEVNGRVVDEKTWSLVGIGTLTGTFEHGGRSVRVEVELPLAFTGPNCHLKVDGTEIPVRQVV